MPSILRSPASADTSVEPYQYPSQRPSAEMTTSPEPLTSSPPTQPGRSRNRYSPVSPETPTRPPYVEPALLDRKTAVSGPIGSYMTGVRGLGLKKWSGSRSDP